MYGFCNKICCISNILFKVVKFREKKTNRITLVKQPAVLLCTHSKISKQNEMMRGGVRELGWNPSFCTGAPVMWNEKFSTSSHVALTTVTMNLFSSLSFKNCLRILFLWRNWWWILGNVRLRFWSNCSQNCTLTRI